MACGLCGASDHYTADHVDTPAPASEPEVERKLELVTDTKPVASTAAPRRRGLFGRLF